jgi:hypothetical protein
MESSLNVRRMSSGVGQQVLLAVEGTHHLRR